jgi:hypothetical protein
MVAAATAAGRRATAPIGLSAAPPQAAAHANWWMPDDLLRRVGSRLISVRANGSRE